MVIDYKFCLVININKENKRKVKLSSIKRENVYYFSLQIIKLLYRNTWEFFVKNS